MVMDVAEVYDFTDKVVVVTGGTGVLLSPAVETLLSLNSQVVLLSRTRDEVQMETFSRFERQPLFISVDVTIKSQILEAREKILRKFGRVDILLNGAGGNRPGATTSEQQTFFDLPESAVRTVFDVNFMGTLLACQIFGEPMAKQRSGTILNISSLSASNPLTRVVSYSAAKAAVENLTRWLAVHMAEEYSQHIRVNAIAPGFLLTSQNRYLLQEEPGRLTARGEQIINSTPMRRFGKPEEMVGTILWLISDASQFVSGVVVPVDGGFSAFSGV